jgi:hypothetical protein
MLLEDDGFIDIQWRVEGQTEPASVRLDIDIASDRLIKATNDSNGDANLWIETLKEATIELGLPSHLSHHNRQLAAKAIWKASEELQKKDDAILPPDVAPGSHGTTESTLSE